MLGVEGYGSDSDSDTDAPKAQPVPVVKLAPATQKKAGLSFPPPNAAASSSKPSSGLSLPAPKKKAPKKIAIGLPALSAGDDGDDTLDDQPPSKKPRIELGSGSSLFSMLPAPKNKNPVPPAPERVLGGGRGPGLVFNTGTKRSAARATVEDAEDEDEESEGAAANVAPFSNSILEEVTEQIVKPKKPPAALPFLPPSLAKGKANVSTEDRPSISKVASAKAANSAPLVDFFSLGAQQLVGTGLCAWLTPSACRVFVVVIFRIVNSAGCFDIFAQTRRKYILRSTNRGLCSTRANTKRPLPRLLHASVWQLGSIRR